MKKYITKLAKFFFVVILFINSVPVIMSTSIFVNPTTGNDNTGNGTIGNPYKTIQKVGSILNITHCDTIFILGTYHYGVKDELIRSDNQNYWIYIRPYNGTNVTLDGLGSTPDSWKAILGVQSSKYVDIGNITVTRNDSASGLRVVSDNGISQYVNIRNCRANNCRRQGILIQAKDVLVENCEIDSVCLRNRFQAAGSAGWDFALGTFLLPTTLQWCQNIIFRNNYVHNVWGEGIVVERAKNFIIENNRVQDCFSACIYADNSRYGIIQRNILTIYGEYYNRNFDPNYSARASGIFWASEGSMHQDSIVQNIDICNNLMVHTGTALGWFDDESNPSIYDSYRKINIYYNTIFDTKSYMVLYIDTLNLNLNRILPDSCNFKNNIIGRAKWNNQYERYFTYSNDFDTAAHRWTVRNNCFIHGLDPRFINNITGSPSFVDSTDGLPNGFKIDSTSICRGQGTYINTYLSDFWNATRLIPPCIGFHEYGGIPSGINPINLEVPEQFQLWQNYPNPFNPVTTIRFAIPLWNNNSNHLVQIKVFDTQGREIAILVNQVLSSGVYEVKFNGSHFASGIYFYTLWADDYTETKKLILLK